MGTLREEQFVGRKDRKHKVNSSLVDIALLTCGLVDLPVFRDCIRAIKLEMESVDCQLHVIMNGVPQEVRKQYEEIIGTIDRARIKYSGERLGFPAAANRVIRQGTSPLVLFVTDDIILHPGALQALVRRMDAPEIGLCGLKLIFPTDSADKARPAGRVQHIGHAVDIRGEITHPLLGWTPENPKCNVSRELQSVTGAVFMVRRNVFIKAGCFFEGYGVGYFEDVDLNLTIRSMGHKIWIDTEAVGTHYTNASFVKARVNIPLEGNKMIFRSRKGSLIQNDSWSFW